MYLRRERRVYDTRRQAVGDGVAISYPGTQSMGLGGTGDWGTGSNRKHWLQARARHVMCNSALGGWGRRAPRDQGGLRAAPPGGADETRDGRQAAQRSAAQRHEASTRPHHASCVMHRT